MEQSQKTFATFSSSFSLSWSTSLLCTRKPLNQVNYEWNGIFWLPAQKWVSMEHKGTKNLEKYFWKSSKSMNLKLTHSLRKTQYLEFEEIIRSLTSQGAKRNLHNRTQIFYGQVDKKTSHTSKEEGLPLFTDTRKDLIQFLLLWNLVGCKCQIPPPPYITTLLKGAKEKAAF